MPWFTAPGHGGTDLHASTCRFQQMWSSISADLEGILVSTVSQNQGQAIQLAFMVVLPQVLLSGLIFPVAAMAAGVRWISYVLPLTYFIEISRGVMLKAMPVSALWQPHGADDGAPRKRQRHEVGTGRRRVSRGGKTTHPDASRPPATQRGSCLAVRLSSLKRGTPEGRGGG